MLVVTFDGHVWRIESPKFIGTTADKELALRWIQEEMEELK